MLNTASALETKNQRHKVLSMSGKCFSKIEFLFLVFNLEAQCLDFQYCKNFFFSFKFEIHMSSETSRTNPSLTYALISLSRILLFSFFLVSEGFWKQNMWEFDQSRSAKIVLGFNPFQLGGYRACPAATELIQRKLSWVLLVLQAARYCPAFQPRLQLHPAGILQWMSLKKGIFAYVGFFYTTRFNHLIGQEYSILA